MVFHLLLLLDVALAPESLLHTKAKRDPGCLPSQELFINLILSTYDMKQITGRVGNPIVYFNVT